MSTNPSSPSGRTGSMFRDWALTPYLLRPLGPRKPPSLHSSLYLSLVGQRVESIRRCILTGHLPHICPSRYTREHMCGFDRHSASPLERLARLHGLETRYRDTRGSWREAGPDTIMMVLGALGVDLEPTGSTRALDAALEARKRELCTRLVEPVSVAWDGRADHLPIRLPTGSGRVPELGRGRSKVRLTLRQEDGLSSTAEFDLGRCRRVVDPEASGSQAYLVPSAMWAGETGLPLGYHRLTVETAGRVGEALIIAAPRRCFGSAASGCEMLGDPFSGNGAMGDLRAALRSAQRAGLGSGRPRGAGTPGRAGGGNRG